MFTSSGWRAFCLGSLVANAFLWVVTEKFPSGGVIVLLVGLAFYTLTYTIEKHMTE